MNTEIETSLDYRIKLLATEVFGCDFKFRENQLEVIIRIVENCTNQEGRPAHLIQAPTGSGKSIILIMSALSLRNFYNINSYILCSDLSLWKQYEDFITHNQYLTTNIGMLKGTHCYTCEKNDKTVNQGVCKLASVAWKDLISQEQASNIGYSCAKSCKYISDKKKAMESDITIMTYQMYFKVVPNEKALSWTPRKVVFCDECHNIPTLLQQNYCPKLKDTDIPNVLKIFDYALSYQDDLFGSEETDEIASLAKTTCFSHQWLETNLKNAFDDLFSVEIRGGSVVKAAVAYRDTLQSAKQISENLLKLISSKTKKGDTKRLSAVEYEVYECCCWLSSTLNMLSDYIEMYDSPQEEEYAVITTSEDTVDMFSTKTGKNVKKKVHIIDLQYAKEDKLNHKYLVTENGPEHVVMTSASIGDLDSFALNMGLFNPIKDDLPSTFDFKNSPVYVLSRWKMSQRYKDENFPKIQAATYELCSRYKNQKGIIQTWTYDIAKKIYDAAPDDLKQRMLLYNDSKEKSNLIEWHKFSPDPTILVGPTLNEGIDLPGDECRFILMLKMPYPYLGSNLVKKKADIYTGWYNNETLKTIIQSIGRGIRYNGDWCQTYILDGCFNAFYYTMKSKFPVEIQQRLKFFK